MWSMPTKLGSVTNAASFFLLKQTEIALNIHAIASATAYHHVVSMEMQATSTAEDTSASVDLALLSDECITPIAGLI
jgi:hypothetical protein